MPSVDVLVTNYNSREAVQLCVESVRRYTAGEDYRLIVYDDCSDNGVDVPYLRAKQAAGWLELVEGREKRLHGGALNYLLNERADAAGYAVILDCDVEILRPRWLPRLIDFLTAGKNTIAACNVLPKMERGPGHWIAPFCEFWFGAINMTAYRDGMQVDWRPVIIRDEREIVRLVQSFAGKGMKQYIFDVGCKLYDKVMHDNPRGYRIASPLPQDIRDSFHHFLQISHQSGRVPEHVRVNVAGKMAVIRHRLEELRSEEGALEIG